MQFELISFPGNTGNPCAVFDLAIARQFYKSSSDVLQVKDNPELTRSALVYATWESVSKFRFFVDERPAEHLIAGAVSKTENAVIYLSSGELCAGWETGFIKPDLWVGMLDHETRDGFRGQFQRIEPGYYRADLFGMLPPVEPSPPVEPHWYDTLAGFGCLAGIFSAAILMWLPFILCVSALLFWNWRFLLGLIPYVPVYAFLKWQDSKLPAACRELKDEFMKKSPDIIVVLTALPADAQYSNTKARVTRPGTE